MLVTLNDDEMQLALMALSELPAKVSYNLLTKLAKVQAEETKRRQIANQPAPVNADVPLPPPEPGVSPRPS